MLELTKHCATRITVMDFGKLKQMVAIQYCHYSKMMRLMMGKIQSVTLDEVGDRGFRFYFNNLFIN